ncbi:NAD(P)H-dependent oxidoreductase [Paenibacillus sp. MWE-103]|uniref:FMN dependent NADH:quinone oxidoreductase n=1 Tax=Paenibacillus artemisiicola TaxID=1172618 RepID=A0ABS3WDN3_9BACL|nr:NAD(P)H-dependent oxidoreductase [Paenibacillus artemisiicola]MBO7746201.1 NAD(P)H-dependent oxidoreductase [Paenibacillus artemisiicola]
MEQLLVINAHPTVDPSMSYSLQVRDRFLETYRQENPKAAISEINLFAEEIPQIDATVLSAWSKLEGDQPLTDEERRVTARMREILEQFKQARRYVIVMPLYNFNIPSRLKDYMDNVLIARETFKYTSNGSVGLLKDGRSLVVIQASSGIYTNNDWYTQNEFSHHYLKSMFNFLGVEDYEIIRVQGTGRIDKDEILAKANQEAEQAAKRLAGMAVMA